MSVFDNISKKVTETAKAAAKKSSEIVEITKLNVNIGAEEDKIEKTYAEIGKAVYASFNEGKEVGEAFTELCGKIKSYEENIRSMRQKIYELKNTKLCPGCGAELDMEIAFCPKCGTKQEMPKPAETEDEEKKPDPKVCPSCNTSNSPESEFCINCGTKLN
ncbi:MAG: zinc ribbon domain-containing protein [Clostridiales bacterium]|jgi:ribosomal protein L40E|nr:zinc ribbon domain-containing protein [Eubacteriales bacterium]MDH7565653.1 zinc ribbon domain-containing protein [Clostridiales bacterium]